MADASSDASAPPAASGEFDPARHVHVEGNLVSMQPALAQPVRKDLHEHALGLHSEEEMRSLAPTGIHCEKCSRAISGAGYMCYIPPASSTETSPDDPSPTHLHVLCGRCVAADRAVARAADPSCPPALQLDKSHIHDHRLGLAASLPAAAANPANRFECQGCQRKNLGVGHYRCVEGCAFDLCLSCVHAALKTGQLVLFHEEEGIHTHDESGSRHEELKAVAEVTLPALNAHAIGLYSLPEILAVQPLGAHCSESKCGEAIHQAAYMSFRPEDQAHITAVYCARCVSKEAKAAAKPLPELRLNEKVHAHPLQLVATLPAVGGSKDYSSGRFNCDVCKRESRRPGHYRCAEASCTFDMCMNCAHDALVDGSGSLQEPKQSSAASAPVVSRAASPAPAGLHTPPPASEQAAAPAASTSVALTADSAPSSVAVSTATSPAVSPPASPGRGPLGSSSTERSPEERKADAVAVAGEHADIEPLKQEAEDKRRTSLSVPPAEAATASPTAAESTAAAASASASDIAASSDTATAVPAEKPGDATSLREYFAARTVQPRTGSAGKNPFRSAGAATAETSEPHLELCHVCEHATVVYACQECAGKPTFCTSCFEHAHITVSMRAHRKELIAGAVPPAAEAKQAPVPEPPQPEPPGSDSTKSSAPSSRPASAHVASAALEEPTPRPNPPRPVSPKPPAFLASAHAGSSASPAASNSAVAATPAPVAATAAPAAAAAATPSVPNDDEEEDYADDEAAMDEEAHRLSLEKEAMIRKEDEAEAFSRAQRLRLEEAQRQRDEIYAKLKIIEDAREAARRAAEEVEAARRKAIEEEKRAKREAKEAAERAAQEAAEDAARKLALWQEEQAAAAAKAAAKASRRRSPARTFSDTLFPDTATVPVLEHVFSLLAQSFTPAVKPSLGGMLLPPSVLFHTGSPYALLSVEFPGAAMRSTALGSSGAPGTEEVAKLFADTAVSAQTPVAIVYPLSGAGAGAGGGVGAGAEAQALNYGQVRSLFGLVDEHLTSNAPESHDGGIEEEVDCESSAPQKPLPARPRGSFLLQKIIRHSPGAPQRLLRVQASWVSQSGSGVSTAPSLRMSKLKAAGSKGKELTEEFPLVKSLAGIREDSVTEVAVEPASDDGFALTRLATSLRDFVATLGLGMPLRISAYATRGPPFEIKKSKRPPSSRAEDSIEEVPDEIEDHSSAAGNNSNGSNGPPTYYFCFADLLQLQSVELPPGVTPAASVAPAPGVLKPVLAPAHSRPMRRSKAHVAARIDTRPPAAAAHVRAPRDLAILAAQPYKRAVDLTRCAKCNVLFKEGQPPNNILLRQVLLKWVPNKLYEYPEELFHAILGVDTSTEADWYKTIVTVCRECQREIRELKTIPSRTQLAPWLRAAADSNIVSVPRINGAASPNGAGEHGDRPDGPLLVAMPPTSSSNVLPYLAKAVILHPAAPGFGSVLTPAPAKPLGAHNPNAKPLAADFEENAVERRLRKRKARKAALAAAAGAIVNTNLLLHHSTSAPALGVLKHPIAGGAGTAPCVPHHPDAPARVAGLHAAAGGYTHPGSDGEYESDEEHKYAPPGRAHSQLSHHSGPHGYARGVPSVHGHHRARHPAVEEKQPIIPPGPLSPFSSGQKKIMELQRAALSPVQSPEEAAKERALAAHKRAHGAASPSVKKAHSVASLQPLAPVGQVRVAQQQQASPDSRYYHQAPQPHASSLPATTLPPPSFGAGLRPVGIGAGGSPASVSAPSASPSAGYSGYSGGSPSASPQGAPFFVRQTSTSSSVPPHLLASAQPASPSVGPARIGSVTREQSTAPSNAPRAVSTAARPGGGGVGATGGTPVARVEREPEDDSGLDVDLDLDEPVDSFPVSTPPPPAAAAAARALPPTSTASSAASPPARPPGRPAPLAVAGPPAKRVASPASPSSDYDDESYADDF